MLYAKHSTPTCSPDLNPIQNLWEYSVRKFYKDYRQFDDIEDLKEAIALSWDSIDTELLIKIVESMPMRCTEVATRGGACATY